MSDPEPRTELSVQNREGADLELLSFRIAEQEYSVNIMSVREIRGWTRATSLPHAPGYVHGVINLRGAVLPVIDLALRLGVEAGAPTERSVIIVVDLGARTIGLRVDAVSDILAIPESALQPPPDLVSEPGGAFVRALTIIEGRMIRVLDLDAVLPADAVAA
jgi:purine-binding chemotaxis protein CheW